MTDAIIDGIMEDMKSLTPEELQDFTQFVMSLKQLSDEVKDAVAALGYVGAKVDYKDAGFHRVSVTVNGEDIGIYDFDRNTFVD